MAIQINSMTTRYEMQESDETYILNKGATVSVNNEDGLFASEFVTNDELVVKGKIVQTGDGFSAIRTDALNMNIDIVKGTSVTGSNGIYSENFEPGGRLEVTVEGVLEGTTGFAIQTADSKDIIVNHGTIKGEIYLGSGKDVFDNRGGKLTDGVHGGAGDDTLVVDSAKTKLIENGGSEGYDTVKSTVSYTLSENVERLQLFGSANLNGKGTNDQSDLFGNKGNNLLSALDGGDILDGGKGNDKLNGGGGNDTFIFKTGHGRDMIMDFENGVDLMDVSGWKAIQDFDDVKSHLSSSKGDLFITVGKDVLILNDTSKNELDADDFIF